MTDKMHKRFLLLGISGVLTGLTVTIPSLGFFEWITLVPAAIFILIESSNPARKLQSLYRYGLFFFMTFYIICFQWFVSLYPLDFIDGMTPAAAIAVVIAGCVGLSFFQAVFGGMLFVAMGILFRTQTMRRHGFLKPILLASSWAIYEWTQTIGWWGVPWARLPLGQANDLINLQTASLFGSYFITFALVLVNAMIAYAFILKKTQSGLKIAVISVAAVFVFQYGVGSMLYFLPGHTDNTVKVAAIQGNISSKDKWQMGTLTKTLNIYEEYTVAAANDGAKIVVWPETVIPQAISEGSSAYKRVAELADTKDIVILVGAFHESDEEGEYNAIFCFMPDGSVHEEIYAKRRLVPFGEFVPMRSLVKKIIPPLADLVMSGEDVLWGKDDAIMDTEYGDIGSLICFDSIYEDLSLSSVRAGAELLCVSTNDSWFGDSAGVYMHNAQSQLRAIETGRCVVRSANTGISTIIDSKGNVLERLEPLVSGYIVGEVTVESDSTLYTVIGNSFIYVAIVVYVCIVGLELARKAFASRKK